MAIPETALNRREATFALYTTTVSQLNLIPGHTQGS
jgi:hypothetical protein